MPIFSVFEGVVAAAFVDDDVDDELLLLLLPQAAIHSPQMAHSATTVRDRGNRCVILLSKLATS